MPTCRYCGKTIMFIKTENGKSMPADPGIKTIIEPGTGKVSDGFIVHWSTCPKAKEAKERKKS